MAYSFQSMTLLRGVQHISTTIDLRKNEESQALDLTSSDGAKTRIQDLGILLGGEGRKPEIVGKGWKGLPRPEDASMSEPVALAMVEGASKSTRVHGIASIVAVHKSVSLEASLNQYFSHELARIMKEAGDLYLTYMEQNVRLRLGTDGVAREGVTGLRAWRVLHGVSAAGDPHKHLHFIFSTTAVGEVSGQTGQIDTDHITRELARKAQAVAQYYIRTELEKLGYRFTLDGEIVGYSRDLIERASTAGNTVDSLQAALSLELGIPVTHEQAWHSWRQIVKGVEDQGVGQELIDAIMAGRELQTIDPQLQAILYRLQSMLDRLQSISEDGSKAGEGIEHELDALLSDPDTAEIVTRFFCDRYEISGVKDFLSGIQTACQEAPELDQVDRVIADIRSCGKAPGLYSCQALCIKVAGEDGAQDLFDKVMLDPRVTCVINKLGRPIWITLRDIEIAEEEVEQLAEQLIPETTGDVQSQLQDLKAALTVITGVAGGGKSTALHEAREAWEGRTVWAAARNRLTATETGRAAGVPPRLAVSMKALRGRIDKGTGPQLGDILVVDEWALLDDVDVDMILGLARSGVVVKGLGDEYQIQPIANGTHARIVIDVARKKGAAELRESRRCETWIDLHDQMREVVKTRNPSKESINALIENLDVRIAFTAADVAEILEDAGPNAVAATASNKDRLSIAEEILETPEPDDLSEILALAEGGAVWAGRDIAIRQNIWDENLQPVALTGQVGKTISVGKELVTIELEGQQITIDRVLAKQHLRLGRRAWTGDSAQGQTWEQGVPVIGGGENSTWLYSTATRSQKAPIVIVMCEKNDDPNVVWDEAYDKLRTILKRDGIARTVKELKADALTDLSRPRSPDEMVPWLREYYGKWNLLKAGIDGGSITLDRSDVQSEPKLDVQSEPKLQSDAELGVVDKPQKGKTPREVLDDLNKGAGNVREPTQDVQQEPETKIIIDPLGQSDNGPDVGLAT